MNKYITVMFPYPSGSGLHIGHWYNYAIVDSYCKVQRMKGHSVFQPFGFDSFGLPAENYARKMGRDAKEVTEENIANFEGEMKRMGTSFDIKFSTHTKVYQSRTQWLFMELHDRGMAYKAFRKQCFCPSCQTVLANEQVVGSLAHSGLPIGGVCERCKTPVEVVEREQWFFKITDYKKRLIDDLAKVDIPEKTKKQQIHWLQKWNSDPQDWCVSRQRSWGCPIPIKGETDTLDTFVDSSFYTIEYDRSRPVDIYVGGNEHACMHLIYARFICKFLFDVGYIDFDEPFKQVIHQGMILGEDGNKMSKSLGNTVSPGQYEPQTLKMYLMFINHYFEGGKWQDAGYKGCEKFKKRFVKWVSDHGTDEIPFCYFKEKVICLFESWKVNRVVSEWMIFYNVHKNKKITPKQASEIILFFDACF